MKVVVRDFIQFLGTGLIEKMSIEELTVKALEFGREALKQGKSVPSTSLESLSPKLRQVSFDCSKLLARAGDQLNYQDGTVSPLSLYDYTIRLAHEDSSC